MAGLQRAVPLLRPAVAAIAAALTIGFLMNDSGIVLPATGIALAVPCLAAAAAQWRLGAPDGELEETAAASLGSTPTGSASTGESAEASAPV